MLAPAATSLVDGQWPPTLLATSFRRGLVMGGALVGAAWWIREIARVFGEGAERDRKGAEGEALTDSALRSLRRHGWRIVHDLEFPGRGNVDHLLVGPGGIIAVDSKYTTERLWVTPKAIGGSRANHIGKAKYAAELAKRALEEAGFASLTVQPALVFWGPGAPNIPGGLVTIQDTLVLEGRRARAWRVKLRDRSPALDKESVRAIAARLSVT